MKALVLRADWEPRDDGGDPAVARPGPVRVARRGSSAWRRPRIALEQVPDPSPRPDGVVIRVRAAGICGSDLHFVERDRDGYMLYPGMVGTPVVTGHEFGGMVEAVGAEVRDLAVGDPVCAEEIAWCGDCFACRSGRPNNCTRLDELGFTFDGAHAELVSTRARYCWSLAPLLEAGIPADRVFELGALVEPTAVAYIGLFVSAGGFAPGSRVGVVGAGPIGLAAIGLARAAGSGRIIAFEPSEGRRGLARIMGADETVDPAELGPGGLAERARDATQGRGVDLWVEASGAAGVTEAMAATLAPGGRVLLLGRGPHRVDLDPESLIVPGAALQGSIGHAGSGAFGRVIDLIAAGRLPIGDLVSRRVDLAGAAALLDGHPVRDAGKTIVRP
jgi:threonine dehydrogenase-like Zn-dependent dehydrogenase